MIRFGFWRRGWAVFLLTRRLGLQEAQVCTLFGRADHVVKGLHLRFRVEGLGLRAEHVDFNLSNNPQSGGSLGGQGSLILTRLMGFH